MIQPTVLTDLSWWQLKTCRLRHLVTAETYTKCGMRINKRDKMSRFAYDEFLCCAKCAREVDK